MIERVIESKVEHFGTRVKLVCLLSKRQWFCFFNDSHGYIILYYYGCYDDLIGIQRVIHDCENIKACDKVPT